MQLVEPLLQPSDSPLGVPPGYIEDLVNRFAEDGLAEVRGWVLRGKLASLCFSAPLACPTLLRLFALIRSG